MWSVHACLYRGSYCLQKHAGIQCVGYVKVWVRSLGPWLVITGCSSYTDAVIGLNRFPTTVGMFHLTTLENNWSYQVLLSKPPPPNHIGWLPDNLSSDVCLKTSMSRGCWLPYKNTRLTSSINGKQQDVCTVVYAGPVCVCVCALSAPSRLQKFVFWLQKVTACTPL